jgi:hypothetical protein
MERTVPSTASDEIDLYLRTIYSLLRSTTEVQIRTLEEVHAGTNSPLHMNARSQSPDISAFIYSQLRLPECMPQVRSIVLGQSPTVFCTHGFPDVETWQLVTPRARRRRCYFDGHETLACFIASRTDIDDVIPTLTAYQIEWNKLHFLLQRVTEEQIRASTESSDKYTALAQLIEMSDDDLARLQQIWGGDSIAHLMLIRGQSCSLGVRLLSGSYNEYRRATREWWAHVEESCASLVNRPVYFISSNPHSFANLLSGFTLRCQKELIDYVQKPENPELYEMWRDIDGGSESPNLENYFYYVMKKYQQTPEGAHLVVEQKEIESTLGITRIPSEYSFDVEAQVMDLSKLDPRCLDSRLLDVYDPILKKSSAMLINIDYPLGLAAYNLLTKIAEHISSILGVYVMGKAATLNGVNGDVMIPNVVQDEHSRNTYLFQNCFTAADVSPYLVFGTVMDNQKAVSVLGTFLQNARIMDVFYREGYTDIEMEAGPYLSAVYEMYRPQRHPINEIVNLYGVPFDVGVLHYASDKPLAKGRNLGAGTLSYYGMDSTYASAIAICRRIFQQETHRLRAHAENHSAC